MRMIAAVALAALLTGPAIAQEFPKPGPEHELLKKQVGTWTSTMKFGDMESKGTVIYKMELGGLWLVGSLEAELLGQKFTGKSLDTYDPVKKKYVGIWVDSMSASPVIMEGTYDKEKQEQTMVGEGPGMDGKPTKYKSITKFQDADTVVMTMYMGDGKDPGFTVTYKRKK
jgi:Protein of unknown function (DUF1579)